MAQVIQKGNVSQKTPRAQQVSFYRGPPSPSLIDFNNWLRGGRMLSFTGLMGLFPCPSVNTAALRAVCLNCFQCVWISVRLGYSVRHILNVSALHSLAHSNICSFTRSIISSLNHWPGHLCTHLFIPAQCAHQGLSFFRAWCMSLCSLSYNRNLV